MTWSAIYGTVGHTTLRKYEGLPPKLIRFDLSQEEFESARELVSGASGPPPVALEFEEFGEEDEVSEPDHTSAKAKGKRPRRNYPGGS